MPHRDAREAHADIGAGAADHEAGGALVVIGMNDRDLIGQGRDFTEQFTQLARLGRIVQAGHELDRLADVGEVGFELLGQIGVEHGGYS
jgi:hypothetical protein